MKPGIAHLLLALVLLLASCTGQPKAVDRYVGTDGLTIEFSQNAPPERIYENTAFPVRVNVQDRGANDAQYDRLLLTFGTDPLYLTGGISPYFPSRHDPDSVAQRRTAIRGKSPGFPDGETLTYEMPVENAYQAGPVVGQRESPDTRMTASVCYAYTTHYGASVCIDMNAYGENLRDQPCVSKDLTATGGQGAPIAVTGVQVKAFPVIDRALGIQATRPQFTIAIEDVGHGQLIGPDTLTFPDACLLQGIPKEQVGSVRVEAYLLKTKLECQPQQFVRLVDGKGEVRCTVPKDDLTDPLYASAQNYQSTIIVNLSYYYKASTERRVTIERVAGSEPGNGGAIPLGGRVTGYEYVRAGAGAPQAAMPGSEGKVPLVAANPVITDATGTEWQLLKTPDGQPVTSCDLYANNPDLIPDDRSRLKTQLTPAWSCACGQNRCATLTRSGQCLSGLCPGSTYCCTDVKPAPEAPVSPPGPSSPGSGSSEGETGTSLSVKATVYYIPDCADFASWSTTRRDLGSSQSCAISSKGFYEDVKCQGSGTCDGDSYTYQTIKPTREASSPGAVRTRCGTVPQAHRTIAVNHNPGTSCYIPYGSRVRLDFGEGNSWNGEYVAEDAGSAITGCHIDVFVGSGKDALAAARSAGLGSKTITATIVERGTQEC